MTHAEWQEFFDGYLEATGRETLRKSEIYAWLKDHPELPAYRVIWAKSDAAAAEAYRIDLIGQKIAKIRLISVDVTPQVSRIRVRPNAVETASVQSYHRPLGALGYRPTQIDLPEHRAALARIAAKALRSWYTQYLGSAALVGIDVTVIAEMADILDETARRQGVTRPRKEEKS